MTTYLLFTVQGYELKTDTGSLLDSCEINLISTSAEDALKRAKGLIKKSNYRVAKITEFYDK
jgi:hypothetical protein